MGDVSDAALLAIIRARIRAARLARNLSQEEVAAAANIEPRTYQHLENPTARRKFNPRLETLLAVARALSIDLGTLVRWAESGELEQNEAVTNVKRSGRKRNVAKD